MDIHRRKALIEQAKQQGIYRRDLPLPVVSLEDFFTGNDDASSIGCNTDNPGPEFFAQPLFVIRAKPNVHDVLIEISEIDEHDEVVWPFAERVYILTRASAEEVSTWLVSLHPDSVEEGWVHGVPLAAPQQQPGIKVYAAWWD